MCVGYVCSYDKIGYRSQKGLTEERIYFDLKFQREKHPSEQDAMAGGGGSRGIHLNKYKAESEQEVG